MQTAFVGTETGQVLEGQVSFPLVVRYDGGKPSTDQKRSQRTQIDTPSGAKVPLSALAEIREDRGPNFIMREGVQRRIVVQCNVAGRDLRSVVNDIQRRVASAVKLPQGYRVEYGGQFESEAAASRRLGLLSILVVIGILLILTTAFGSARDALIIMLNLPACAGRRSDRCFHRRRRTVGCFDHRLYHAVRNRNPKWHHAGLSHPSPDEVEGVTDLRQAVMQGASRAGLAHHHDCACGGLALIPVALGMGKPGSEIQAPMALVILCGLLSSTALNMVVVPAAWFRYGRVRDTVMSGLIRNANFPSSSAHR